jgi:hypothetical protein
MILLERTVLQQFVPVRLLLVLVCEHNFQPSYLNAAICKVLDYLRQCPLNLISGLCLADFQQTCDLVILLLEFYKNLPQLRWIEADGNLLGPCLLG